MQQTICKEVHDAIKKYQIEPDIIWEDLGFHNEEDMLHKIQTDIQIALWALMELEHFSDWENGFLIDSDQESGGYIYKVKDFTFKLNYHPLTLDIIITPVKKITKMVEQTFWEVDESIKI